MKTLAMGMAALACMALTAFVGASTASATVLVGNNGVIPAETTASFALSSGTSTKLLTTTGETLDSCTESAIKTEITSVGGEEAAVVGTNKELTWGSCLFSTHTTSLGKLEISFSSGSNGTVKAGSEISVTANTAFGSCIYGATAGTTLGTLTGGAPSAFDVNVVVQKLSGSSFLCPSSAKWTATYTNTEPEGKLEVAVAPEYRSTASPVVFLGKIGPTQSSVWEIEISKATCTGAEFESAATATPAKTISLLPQYTGCSNFGFNGMGEASFTSTGGCKFELLQPAVPKPKGGMESNVAIRCPTGKAILIRGENVESECEVAIGEPKNGKLAKSRYTNLGGNPTKFEIAFELAGITAEVTKTTGKCPLTKGEKNNVTYKAQVNIEDKAGKAGVSVG